MLICKNCVTFIHFFGSHIKLCPMKTSLFILFAFLMVMLSCSSPQNNEAQETPPSLDSLLHAYHEERLKLFPFDATMAGDNRYNDLLPNSLTADFRQQVSDFYSRYFK